MMISKQMFSSGKEMSPLFEIPGFSLKLICIDVLHALDLGFTQEAMGNVLYECLGIFVVGSTIQEKIDNLVIKMKDH